MPNSHANPSLNDCEPACVGGGVHKFIELNYAEAVRKNRRDIAAWGYCEQCGAVLEVFTDFGSTPQVSLPRIFKPEARHG